MTHCFVFDFARVSKSSLKSKMRLQDIIHCSYNKSHDWCRGIKHSSLFSHACIVFSEEIFIKMNHRIVRFNICLLIQSVHQCSHICMSENLTKFIHNISESLFKSFTSYMIKEFSQKWVTLWNEVTSF